MRSPHLAAAALLLAGCATPLASLNNHREITTPVGKFVLESAEADAGEETVQKAVLTVSPRLDRWGGPREPVRVHILPNHALLEQAVNKGGYGWLRAWARYDEVFIQSPRSWSVFGATQGEVEELLQHELTHCVMYQQSATRTGWSRKEIPLWFREGMASFSANQGYRWPTLEDLAQFYEQHPNLDPVTSPDELYQSRSDTVYGAAHHAFTFLARRYGEDTIRGVLTAMSRGAVFPDAFTAVIGIPPRAFVDDFKRYVRLRGFRGGRLRQAPRTGSPPTAPP